MSGRVEPLAADMAALQESRQADTKSSAGDKQKRRAPWWTKSQLSATGKGTAKPIGVAAINQACEVAARGAAVETNASSISSPFHLVNCRWRVPNRFMPFRQYLQLLVMLGKRAGEFFEINGARHAILKVY